MELTRTYFDQSERLAVKGRTFEVIHNDCVMETAAMPVGSVDMVCTSIPFGNQFEYSTKVEDFGHNKDDGAFFAQMDFLVPELHRVLRPGRIAAIHVKDRILFGNVTGYASPTVNPFSDKTTACFLRHGFVLMARITIDTDVVRENAQTYRLSWSENAKDSTKMGAGMPEYVLVFRKLPTDLANAYADVPVTKLKGTEQVCQQCRRIHPEAPKGKPTLAQCPECQGAIVLAADDAELGPQSYTRADWQMDAAGLWRSNGNRMPDPEILQHMSVGDVKRLWDSYSRAGGYSHEEHVAVAKALEARGKLPGSWMLFPPVSRHADVWTDIQRINTLNSKQSQRNEEKHVCPLQLDIIKRLITRYTNRGEKVFDPFGGIGSVPYQALKMGRHALMTELNRQYWECAVGYCERAEEEQSAPTLFDLAVHTV